MLTKTFVCFALLISFQATQAAEYTLSVQPLMKPERAKVFFKPLTDYLSAETGETIKLKAYRTFKSYWYHMKRDEHFDLALDAAHFVDYRIKNKKHTVVAKLADTVSFTVATREDLFIFDVEELAPLKVACVVAPGAGGLWLKKMYPDYKHRPKIVPSYDAADAVKHLHEGRADAVLVPTPLIGNFPDLNVVMTTDPAPHQGFTASPLVPAEVVKKIKKALINASKTKEGKKMLSAINAIKFVAAKAKTYDGYMSLLDVMKKR
jgi:hypothetical protein